MKEHLTLNPKFKIGDLVVVKAYKSAVGLDNNGRITIIRSVSSVHYDLLCDWSNGGVHHDEVEELNE